MTGLTFSSKDERYGLYVSGAEWENAKSLCSASGKYETGGILIGRYSNAQDCARISEIVPPPKNSQHSRTQFVRGTKGLQKRLIATWKRRQGYYLGEWHYHPSASAHYSQIDSAQMARIASDPKYHCPEPILIIVGGDRLSGWKISAHVFFTKQSPVEIVLNQQI